MKYLLLDKIIPSNSTMVGEIFENSYLEFLKNASKMHGYLLLDIIPSNSTMVGENFKNSYHESLMNALQIHEIFIIRQNHSY